MIGLLIGREVVLAGTVPFLRSRGITALPTLYLGKAATFALMYALPMLLAGTFDNTLGAVMHPWAGRSSSGAWACTGGPWRSIGGRRCWWCVTCPGCGNRGVLLNHHAAH